ncbi:MAG TPA: hypothetical protein VIV56_02915, partial [Gemmatimonadales bacterium]
MNETLPPILSVRDVTVEHQAAAMVAGYNSTLEYVVDELGRALREHEERIAALEAELQGVVT